MPEMRAQTEREAQLEGITEQETGTLPYELTALSEPARDEQEERTIVTDAPRRYAATHRAERLLHGPRLEGQAGTLPTELARHRALHRSPA